MNEIYYIYIFLFLLILFLTFYWNKIGKKNSEYVTLIEEVSKIKSYNSNLLIFIESISRNDFWETIKQNCSNSIILFGYNQIARVLINNFEKNDIKIRFVVENNQKIREGINKYYKNISAITTNDLLIYEKKNPDLNVLICVLHDSKYKITQDLKIKSNDRLNVFLLEGVMKKNKI